MTQTPDPATSDDDIPAPISKLELDGRTIYIRAFRSVGLAFDSAARHPRYSDRVVMGDCPWYWVVSPADSQRLERAGYELATRSSLIR